MSYTSLGYHTFTIYLNLTIDEARKLYSAFSLNDRIKIIPGKYNEAPSKADDFMKSLYASNSKNYTIVYPYENMGIHWHLRISYFSPGYIKNDPYDRRKSHQQEYKPCSIKATINPKIFTGIYDYVGAATYEHLYSVELNFNREAKSISPILGNFNSYSLNRVDYCINFDLKQLSINCPPDKMMQLIKRADIPYYFNEWKEFSCTSHRQVAPINSFYLINNSVNINTYWKGYQLQKNFSDCDQVDAAANVIRFEIQCKYPKVYNMMRIKYNIGFPHHKPLDEMLSDSFCFNVVLNYYKKSIRMGDYYTLATARKIIKNQRFHINKETRLIKHITYINCCRGIANAKSVLKEYKREDFRRSLRELGDLNINPVTIPKEWNIKFIPNLLSVYQQKELA